MNIMLNRRRFIISAGAILVPLGKLPGASSEGPVDPDICVYGGTAAGVVAAVAAAREGSRVVLVEPSRWLGGMTGGGLSHIDWGRVEAVGGMASRVLADGMTDNHYRQVFENLVKEHRITVIREHWVADTQREGTVIRSITLDHAPPDRFGCPAAEPRKARATTIAAKVFIDC